MGERSDPECGGNNIIDKEYLISNDNFLQEQI